MNKKDDSRMNFLLSFFTGEDYQEKNINGFWLIKHGKGVKIVGVYREENYKKYKQAKLPYEIKN